MQGHRIRLKKPTTKHSVTRSSIQARENELNRNSIRRYLRCFRKEDTVYCPSQITGLADQKDQSWRDRANVPSEQNRPVADKVHTALPKTAYQARQEDQSWTGTDVHARLVDKIGQSLARSAVRSGSVPRSRRRQCSPVVCMILPVMLQESALRQTFIFTIYSRIPQTAGAESPGEDNGLTEPHFTPALRVYGEVADRPAAK